jgi:hypothetical protein
VPVKDSVAHQRKDAKEDPRDVEEQLLPECTVTGERERSVREERDHVIHTLTSKCLVQADEASLRTCALHLSS